MLQEGGAVPVFCPAATLGLSGGRSCVRIGEEFRIHIAVGGEFLFQPGHPRRDGDAEHVADGTGVAGGDQRGEARDFRREHRHR